MARRWFLLLLSLALAGLVAVLLFWHPAERSPVAPPATASSQDRPAATVPAEASTARSQAAPTERSQLADELNAPTGDVHADLRIVAEVLMAYRSNFPHSGNPVGDNREITAALTGRNRLHLALVPPDHPAINRNGELCDRWGTPFFFHAESGTHMAIRSAGPDRKMWTADDIVLEP